MLPGRPVLLAASPDPGVRRLLRRDFTKAGLTVITAETGRMLLDHASRSRPSVIVTSSQMNDVNGVDLVEAIRKVTDVPILMLLPMPLPVARQDLLDAGAEDCLDEPFMPAELAARVRRLIHRLGGLRAYRQIATASGNLEVNTVEGSVRLNGSPIMLTRKEFDLLALLASQDGMALSHDEILQAMWSTEDAGVQRNLRRVISTLRSKLEPNPHNPVILKSERGRGYRLVAQRGFDEDTLLGG
jgi:DNA-binding response OmpR family regulator